MFKKDWWWRSIFMTTIWRTPRLAVAICTTADKSRAVFWTNKVADLIKNDSRKNYRLESQDEIGKIIYTIGQNGGHNCHWSSQIKSYKWIIQKLQKNDIKPKQEIHLVLDRFLGGQDRTHDSKKPESRRVFLFAVPGMANLVVGTTRYITREAGSLEPELYRRNWFCAWNQPQVTGLRKQLEADVKAFIAVLRPLARPKRRKHQDKENLTLPQDHLSKSWLWDADRLESDHLPENGRHGKNLFEQGLREKPKESNFAKWVSGKLPAP